MRNRSLLLTVLAAGASVALIACGDSSASSAPPATPADTTEVTATTAAPTPTPPPPAPAAEPPAPDPAAEEAANEGIRDHHRHHRGGVAQFIILSLDTLGLSPEQKAKVESIKADLTARTAPAHDAEKALLGTIADGVAAGKIDKHKVDVALGKLSKASADAHGASADAFNQLHSVLTAQERNALVDKVQAHWAVWRSVNLEEKAESHEKGSRLGHFAEEESLTPEQTEKISAALQASKPDAKSHVDPAEMEQFLKTFTAAFASDTFDAKAFGKGGAVNGKLNTAGGWRLAHFFEVVTPVLTPEQRTNVAAHLRERIEMHG